MSFEEELVQSIPLGRAVVGECSRPYVCVSRKTPRNPMCECSRSRGLTADALGPVVPEGDGGRRRGGWDRVVVLADGVAWG